MSICTFYTATKKRVTSTPQKRLGIQRKADTRRINHEMKETKETLYIQRYRKYSWER